MDKYIIEQYDEFLIKTNSYNSNDFYFLKSIISVYLKLIEAIIPNIYLL